MVCVMIMRDDDDYNNHHHHHDQFATAFVHQFDSTTVVQYFVISLLQWHRETTAASCRWTLSLLSEGYSWLLLLHRIGSKDEE